MKRLSNRSPPARPALITIPMLMTLAIILLLSLWYNTSRTTPPTKSPNSVIRIAYYTASASDQSYLFGQSPSSSVDLFAEIARRENWQVEPIFCSWRECIRLLRNNEIEILTDVIYSQERDEFLDFNNLPIAETWSQVYASVLSGISSWEDLSNKRIAMLSGSIQESLFSEAMAEQEVKYTPVATHDIRELFLLVKRGDAHAAVSDYFYGEHYATEFDLIATPLIFNREPFYYATAAGQNQHLLKFIDKYLSVWQSDPDSPYFQVIKDTVSQKDKIVTPRWIGVIFFVLFSAIGILLVGITILRLRVKKSRQQFHDSLHRFDFLASSNNAIIFTIRNSEFAPDWISDSAEKVLGFPANDLLRIKKWNGLILPQDNNTVSAVRGKLATDSTISHQFRIRDAHGDIRHIREEMRWFPWGKNSQEIVGIWLDVTASHLQEEKVRYLVNFDTLTGLPNRSLLQRHLEEKVVSVQGDTAPFLLGCLNVDRFININKSFSSSVVDSILVELVRRLESVLPSSTFIARTGASEFYFILLGATNNPKSSSAADLLLREIPKPINVQDTSLRLSISVGICEYATNDYITADRLILRAELAMAEAKRNGGNQLKFYEDSFGHEVSKRFQIENALRHPIDFTCFEIRYQPQIDLTTQQLVGVEALVYWQHPQLGLLPPAAFIPIAEETSSIGYIDDWVLNTACHQLAKWDSQGFTVPKLSINVSARECTSQSLVDRIQSALALAIIQPSRLCLEITESMIVDNPAQTNDILSKLRALGVGIAMDDFGTAYANFAQLGQLPIDCLKIDKTFIQLIETSVNNQAIIRSIIALAKELGLQVVAEGVESAAQADFLIVEGCNIAQGFLLGRPMEVEQLLTTQKTSILSGKLC